MINNLEKTTEKELANVMQISLPYLHRGIIKVGDYQLTHIEDVGYSLHYKDKRLIDSPHWQIIHQYLYLQNPFHLVAEPRKEMDLVTNASIQAKNVPIYQRHILYCDWNYWEDKGIKVRLRYMENYYTKHIAFAQLQMPEEDWVDLDPATKNLLIQNHAYNNWEQGKSPDDIIEELSNEAPVIKAEEKIGFIRFDYHHRKKQDTPFAFKVQLRYRNETYTKIITFDEMNVDYADELSIMDSRFIADEIMGWINANWVIPYTENELMEKLEEKDGI